ncbi:MAG: integration host factor subunit alpha [bacterium]
MTKEDITRNVWQKLNVTNKEASMIVEEIFNTIKKALARGEQIEIRGFGKFSIRSKSERIGRNPRTGEEKVITARKVVTFKSSKIFRNVVN